MSAGQNILVSVAMALATVPAVLAAVPEPQIQRTDSIAAVFPPWWSQRRVIETVADTANLLDVGAWPSVVVVRFSDQDLVTRLRERGALLIIDGDFAGCLSLEDQNNGR
ncbi:hypothetical protein [Jiella marina]|uniref:hypothetical protein n=1 Tax=Jiella sp. LLJ827 TaxID=2917712 RepID=UPI002101879C|nr:hypothetical protein [Jiella sp. LLJ827]MCQ0990640.1 hypothetical protein [Jiella sp. LLJ827]